MFFVDNHVLVVPSKTGKYRIYHDARASRGALRFAAGALTTRRHHQCLHRCDVRLTVPFV
jgi:hypothetical protein